MRLAGERETLGLYPHRPSDRALSNRELPRLVQWPTGDLAERAAAGSGRRRAFLSAAGTVTVAGLILEHAQAQRSHQLRARRSHRPHRGDAVRGAACSQYRDLLVKDALVLVEGNLRFDEFSNAWRIAGKTHQAARRAARAAGAAARAALAARRCTAREARRSLERLRRAARLVRPGSVRGADPLPAATGARCTLTLGANWAVRPDARADGRAGVPGRPRRPAAALRRAGGSEACTAPRPAR